MNHPREYEKIHWWHSIELGDGIVTPGVKSAQQLQEEFTRLQLTAEMLQGKRVLDIGCNDGFMCLACERLGAEVVGIDGIFRDGLKYVRAYLNPKFQFYCIDLMSPSFLELGRFDVILYFGVLYHSIYPFEQITRIASVCSSGATLFLESEYYDLNGFEKEPTLIFNYDGRISSDPTSPTFPSVSWITQTLACVGFDQITLLHRTGDQNRGRVTVRAHYRGGSTASPILYAAEQK